MINKDFFQALNDLETQKGNKVVLLGYSAGSFVTYQYYLTRGMAIIPAEISKGKYGEEADTFIANTPIQPTCFNALVEAEIIQYNPETGKYKPISDTETFKKNYANYRYH